MMAAEHAEHTKGAEGVHTLTFLGTGAACGVPSFYCGCAACEEARRDARAARGCSGLLVAGAHAGAQRTLIDAPPELRGQLVREGVDGIDHLLLTHEHFDHVGGIPQLEFYVRLKTKEPLPVYAGAQTLASIERQFGFMADVLKPRVLEAFVTLYLDGVGYTPLPAAHGRETFGFLIETAHSRTAYFPDTGPLPQQARAYLEGLERLDTLIIDATFNGANWMPHEHHTIDEAAALIEVLGARRGYLTHLSMHYDEPITLARLEERLRAFGGTVAVAHDGLRLALD
jgi:phosphoribosyl 1,2-cyclic phosphate phosphodiesterase